MTSKRLLLILAMVVGASLLIQWVPYGHSHSNPPTSAEPSWPSPETRALAARACFDCHSNETKWPWYSSVAPVSWLVVHDVQEGREALNFSEWDRPRQRLREIGEVLREGEMAPAYYRLTHAEARLSAGEKDQLEQALTSLQ